MTQTARGRSRLLTGCSVVALGVVVVAPAAASWHGLVMAGRMMFGLSDGWEYVVPLTLDGAALYAAFLAFRAILSTDSAVGPRLLTAVYAFAAATFNFVRAREFNGDMATALFFAGASLSAVVLWDVTLRLLRRDQLRELGAVESPLPRFRMLRWLVAPIETARAWRLAVVEQISDPLEALHRSRQARTDSPLQAHAERLTDSPALPESASSEGDTDEQDSSTDEEQRRIGQAGELAAYGGAGLVRDRHSGTGSGSGGHGLELVPERAGKLQAVHSSSLRLSPSTSKADALRAAFDLLGTKDVPAALALLSEHGMTVDRSYAYTINWSPSPLRAVSGGA